MVGGAARGNGSGLERAAPLIWRQLTPTGCISIGEKCIKSAFGHAKTFSHILIANMMNVLFAAMA